MGLSGDVEDVLVAVDSSCRGCWTRFEVGESGAAKPRAYLKGKFLKNGAFLLFRNERFQIERLKRRKVFYVSRLELQ